MGWRDIAKPIITEVLERTKEAPTKERRKALREAYPFGERKYWPYKVWLNEIKRQRTGWTPINRRKPKVHDNPAQGFLEFAKQITIAEVYGEIEIK